jgi:hypothetical protein
MKTIKALKKEIKDTRRYKELTCSRSKYGCITKNNLQTQHDPHQNINDILHRNRRNNPKIHMETQKTPNRQSNLEHKEQCCRYHNTDFKLHYKTIAKKYNMLCKNKHMEQWD